MAKNQYTYAVARIRSMEVSLFSQADIEQLLACRDEKQCLQLLQEKGWGNADTPSDAEAILTCEREKTWAEVGGMIDDMSVFDVLSYPDLFHNLKAAIKMVASGTEIPGIFISGTRIPAREILDSVKNKEFEKLPDYMAGAAREAYETLLHTQDGQLCDIMIDRAALEAVYQAGKNAEDDIIREYAESTVAVADIKIAVRSQKTAKSLEFMKNAMAECGSLDVDALCRAALSGVDTIAEYLEGTAYKGGAQALRESASAFECWCDNRIIETIRPQLYNPFTIGPVVAYVLARENEIKTVRIILTGKQNELPEESIRERVREMYV